MKTLNKKIYLLSFLLPIIAILWRVLYRSYHYAGWEIANAARGLLLIEYLGVWEAIKESFYITRHCQYCGGAGFIKTFIPGFLTFIYPWEYWALTFFFFLSVLIVWITGVAFRLKGKQWAIFALAIGSSATILSQSIYGGYVAGFLPHALALLIIFNPYFRKRWWLGLLLGLITIEISWHGYSLGKIIFIVFFLAALFQTNANIKNRIVNFLLGSISALLLYITNVGLTINTYKRFDNLIEITRDNIYEILKTIFYDPGQDLMILPVLGIIGLFFLRRNRIFFTVALLSQWILFLHLALHGVPSIRPRRFLYVEYYNIIIILVVLQQWWPEIKKPLVRVMVGCLVTVLLYGNFLQFKNLKEFTSVDIHEQKYSMPYMFSHGDYFIRPQLEDAARDITKLVNQGKKIILIYNAHVFNENATNPEKLPERLYIKLGHEDFIKNIIIFNHKKRKIWQVPMLPMSGMKERLDEIKFTDNYLILAYQQKRGHVFQEEAAVIMNELNNRFKLVEQEGIPEFKVYKIYLKE